MTAQTDACALLEAKRALVEKGRDAYLANLTDREDPCRGCPVPGLDAAYFAESGCRGCPFEHRANHSQASSTCQNEEKRHPNEFEGCEITTLTYRGKPAWIAREIGEAIGYSQGGKRFATSITGEWAGEFIEGLDYVLLTGKELADFKDIFELGTSPVPSHAPQIMLLFETGLYLALAKTNKPVGKRLRRFLAEEVLPQIARDGSYLPGDRNSSAIDARIAREQRLARQLEFRAIKELVKTLRATGKCSENVLINHEIAAAEAATGMNLSELKPWLSPSEIADEFGVSPLRIGLTVTKLGIRGNIKGIARPVVEGRVVKGYLYSPRAVQQIADQLAYDGHIPRRVESFFFKDGSFNTWRCRRCGNLLGVTDGERVEIQTAEGDQCLAGLPAICACECNTINELHTSKPSKGAAARPLRIVH